MAGRCNQLAKPEKEDILAKLNTPVSFSPSSQPFGDGHAAEKTVDAITRFFEGKGNVSE